MSCRQRATLLPVETSPTNAPHLSLGRVPQRCSKLAADPRAAMGPSSLAERVRVTISSLHRSAVGRRSFHRQGVFVPTGLAGARFLRRAILGRPAAYGPRNVPWGRAACVVVHAAHLRGQG
jgi:hypothetical protein